MEEEDDDDDDEKRRGKLIQSCQEDNMYTFVIVPNDFSGSTNTAEMSRGEERWDRV